MERMYDIGSEKVLNIGNSYTYTVLAADHAQYGGFFLTAAGSITVSDGVNSILLTLLANEEVLLNPTITTMVETADNSIIFQY